MKSQKNSLFFEYSFHDSDNSVTIQIKSQNGVIDGKFQVSLSESKTSIQIVYNDNILAICGKLNSKVKSIADEKYENGEFSLRIIKSELKKWRILITSRHEETQEIDFQSSFLLYKFMNDYSGESEESIEYLKYSSLGYLSGIYELSTYYFTKDQRENGISLLKYGVEKFRDPKCMYNLGIIYINDKENRLKGFQLLKLASELKYGPSYRIIGQLYSPLSDKEFSNKNGFEALKFFDLAVNYQPKDAISLYEMAKLIYKGIGTKQSVKYALMLEKKAMGIDKNLKPLRVFFEENQKKNTINWEKHVSFIAFAVVGVSLYCYFRKRKR